MQNFTGSWARAASQPMPRPQAPMAAGPGPLASSLRPQPKPEAGLNENPKSPWINGILGIFMNQMMGGKPRSGADFYNLLKPRAEAPAAGLADDRSTRMDRASRLMGIGANLMD